MMNFVPVSFLPELKQSEFPSLADPTGENDLWAEYVSNNVTLAAKVITLACFQNGKWGAVNYRDARTILDSATAWAPKDFNNGIATLTKRGVIALLSVSDEKYVIPTAEIAAYAYTVGAQ